MIIPRNNRVIFLVMRHYNLNYFVIFLISIILYVI